MQYFSNVAVAKIYAVSEGTVRRWIGAARNGKSELQLYEHNGKQYIANTTKNKIIIEELVRRGKKHKNSRWHKEIVPKSTFYRLYDKKQVLDIISNIDIHHEIPQQYSYFGKGAMYWDAYARRLWKEETENMLIAAIELLASNLENIRRLLAGRGRVNIIDLGVGNALPIKDLLTHLLYEENILGRYIGIDTSVEMLEIAERNIGEWFAGRVEFEGYNRDMTYERFDDLLVDENPTETTNIVLLLGGTIAGFRSPDEVFKVICHSLGRSDLLIVNTKLDSEEARRYFDFSAEASSVEELPLDLRILLDLLNIDKSLYVVEKSYDSNLRARFIKVRLNLDLDIHFKTDGLERYVHFLKGDAITLWRFWHQDTGEYIKQLERNGFAMLETSATADRQYLLTISKLDTEI